MPLISSDFQPAWWLPGAHLQTLWPAFFRPRPRLALQSERLELADGDFLDLIWSGPPKGRIILLLHGLEGTLNSHYVRSQMQALNKTGYRTCFMQFRSCSGEPNRLPRIYHSGETGDLQTTLDFIQAQHQSDIFAIIGVSLGGNVLLKWLGENGQQARITTAIAVSVPFILAHVANRLNRGISRIYQHHLLRLLKEKIRKKNKYIPLPHAVDLKALNSFYQFDDEITAPLHGFRDAHDYYQQCSCLEFLKSIHIPTLVLHAKDDPFMWPETIPGEDQLTSSVTLELSEKGGHAGFVTGSLPWRPVYWLEQRIQTWLATY